MATISAGLAAATADDRGGPRMIDDPGTYDTVRRRPRRLPMTVVLVGLVLWSLLAFVGYALVDPVLD